MNQPKLIADLKLYSHALGITAKPPLPGAITPLGLYADYYMPAGYKPIKQERRIYSFRVWDAATGVSTSTTDCFTCTFTPANEQPINLVFKRVIKQSYDGHTLTAMWTDKKTGKDYILNTQTPPIKYPDLYKPKPFRIVTKIGTCNEFI